MVFVLFLLEPKKGVIKYVFLIIFVFENKKTIFKKSNQTYLNLCNFHCFIYIDFEVFSSKNTLLCLFCF